MIHLEKTEAGEYHVSSNIISMVCETFGDAIAIIIDEHEKGNI